MAIWGLNFSIVKLGLDTLDPMLLTALRFTLAGLSPGMAALLIQTNVVFGLGLGWLLLKESVSPLRSLGALIALCGLALSLTVSDGSVTLIGVGLILVAALCWSISGVLLKQSNTQHVFAFSVWCVVDALCPDPAVSSVLPSGWDTGLYDFDGQYDPTRCVFHCVPGIYRHVVWLLALEQIDGVLPFVACGPVYVACAPFCPVGFKHHVS